MLSANSSIIKQAANTSTRVKISAISIIETLIIIFLLECLIADRSLYSALIHTLVISAIIIIIRLYFEFKPHINLLNLPIGLNENNIKYCFRIRLDNRFCEYKLLIISNDNFVIFDKIFTPGSQLSFSVHKLNLLSIFLSGFRYYLKLIQESEYAHRKYKIFLDEPALLKEKLIEAGAIYKESGLTKGG